MSDDAQWNASRTHSPSGAEPSMARIRVGTVSVDTESITARIRPGTATREYSIHHGSYPPHVNLVSITAHIRPGTTTREHSIHHGSYPSRDGHA